MIRLLLLSVFCSFTSPFTSQVFAKSFSEQLMTMLKAGAEDNTSGSCKKAADADLEKRVARELSFSQKQKCDDLFSSTSPDWVKKSKFAGVLASDSGWTPYCSLRSHAGAMKSHSEENASDLALQDVAKSDLYLKECKTEKDEIKAEKKIQESEKLSDGARALVEARFKDIKEQVKKDCCAGNSTCESTFEAIPMKWCDQLGNKKEIKNCGQLAGQFSPALDEQIKKYNQLIRDFRKQDNPEVFKGAWPATKGELDFSPFAEAGKDVPRESLEYVIRHELTHACGQIQLDQAINTGDEDAIYTYGNTYTSCEIDFSSQAVYQARFKKLGLSNESIECVVKTANDSIYSRYSSKPCKSGCPMKQIEESYADIGAISKFESKDLIPWVLPDVCGYARDNQHPYFGDDLKCLTLTPAFLERFKTASQCAK